MGNGRLSGKGLGRSLGKNAERGLMWVAAPVAMVLLLLAGAVLLGFSPCRYAQKAAARVPASPVSTFSRSSLHAKPDARAVLGQLPLIFEPNQGQADPGVKFLTHGAGYSLALDETGAVLGMQIRASKAARSDRVIRMKLVGANPEAVTAGSDPLPGKSNYILGNDPHKWHSGIPQFGGVHYTSVYPGIDLVFYGRQGHLEYDFKVAPGADPSLAELQFEGASKLKLSGGDLILTGEDDGGLRLQAPQIYQRDGERQQPIAGRFVLRTGNRVGFEVGPYDRSRELVIDPILFFSTYFGGSGTETSPSVAVNGDGNIYLVGSTTSPPSSFVALTGLTPTQLGPSPNIFVVKIDPSQPPSVVFATFLGGNGTDTSVGIGVDGAGNPYIVGNTSSSNFPMSPTNPGYQTSPETKIQCTSSPTCTSVFVSVLNGTGTPPGGTLTYSSYLSGNGDDQATGMTIDANGNVFVTGNTTSTDQPSASPAIDFPASNLPVPYQTVSKAPTQFFVTKVNTRTSGAGSIAYSTYFGGGVTATGTVAVGGGIAVDAAGNMYFSGTTNFYNSGQGNYGDSNQSIDFPILNAYQPCLDTPPPTVLNVANPCSAPSSPPYNTDAFVAKINPNALAGTQLLFSTYLGGTGTDTSTAITIDSGATNIYLTGSTNSSDFVLPTGIAPFQSCLNNANPSGSTAACSTANTTSTDAYVARMSNPTLSTSGTPNDVQLAYFSYLGGSGNDAGLAIAVDTASDALVTGSTNSSNFPITANPIQSQLTGTQNAFFAHIDTTTTSTTQTGSYSTYFGGNGVDRGTSVAVDPVTLNTYFAGDTTSTTLHTADALQPTLKGIRNTFVAELVPAPGVCINCVPPLLSVTQLGAGNPVTATFTVSNQGPDLATGVSVFGTAPTGITLNSGTAGSGTCSPPSNNTVSCIIPTLQAGSSSQVTFSATPTGPCSHCTVMAQVVEINNSNTSGITPAIASFTAGAFSLTVGPNGQTKPAGQVAQYTATLTPIPAFGNTVSVSCTAPPAGSCSATSSPITFSDGVSSASTVLNVQTTPQVIAKSTPWHGPMYALWMMVPGMAWLGFGAGKKRRGSKWLGLFALSVFFTLVLVQPSCSSPRTPTSTSGTPPGTYSLTVTATSGSYSKTQSFQLTVIP